MKKLIFSSLLIFGCLTSASASETNVSSASETNVSSAVETTVDLVKGKKLFSKCVACHGSQGNRKAFGKSNLLSSLSEKEIIESLKGYKAGTLNHHGMGAVMKGQLVLIDEKDFPSLAAYIASLK